MLQSCQSCRIMLILDEVAGIIKIDILVRVATCKTLDVVEATQSDNAINQFRMTEGEIDGMVSTEACTRSNQEGIGVQLFAEWQDFVQDVVLVLDMSQCPFSRMFSFGIPAFAINAIDTKHLKPSVFQVLTQLGHHASIFPLEETAL